jgi:hypothetical protein
MRAILQLDLPHEIRHQLLVLHQAPRLPAPDFPRATTRTTTAVPVRSKQRSHPPDDPQPKKKQRTVLSTHHSTIHPIPLPIIEEVPPDGFNSEDSDEEVASRAPSVHTTSAVDAGPVTLCPMTPTPQFLLELQLQQILLRTPPLASSNRQIPTGAILLHLSDLGQTLKIKS